LDLHKRIIEAWKNEFGDIKKSSNVLSSLLKSKFNGGVGEPTSEEIAQVLKDFSDIPKIAPLVAIILTSPIPGSSLGYLALMSSLKKLSNNKINLIPKRFGEIFNTKSEPKDPS